MSVPSLEIELAAARRRLAGQPGYAMFALFLALTTTAAAALQLADLAFGLAFQEVFFFAGPVLIWTAAAGLPARASLKLARPSAGLLGLGLLVGAANFLFAGILQALARALVPEALARRFDATRIFRDAAGPELAALVLAIALVAPACEELAFRGYLQTVLRARYRDGRAVLIAAALFALLHLDPVGMVARVELGAVFGLLTLWSGSIWPAAAAHLANNSLASGLLLAALRRGAPPEPPSELAPEVVGAALASAAATVLLLREFRARAGPPRPVECDLLAPARPPRRPGPLLARWALAAALALAAFFAVGWRGAAVNYVDALHPLGDLDRRLPPTAEREALQGRLHAARAEARGARMSLGRYLRLREALGARGGRSPALTPELIERAFAGAAADPPPRKAPP